MLSNVRSHATAILTLLLLAAVLLSGCGKGQVHDEGFPWPGSFACAVLVDAILGVVKGANAPE